MSDNYLLEQDRLAALRSYHILDTLPEEEFDRLTRLASAICKMPMSLISLIDEERQWFKSSVGIDSTETSREDSFCRYTILGESMLEVKDAAIDERFKDNPFVLSAPHVRYYAGYPLVEPGGHKLGSLCVLDVKPSELDQWQKEALKILAEEVVDRIVKRRVMEEDAFFKRIFELANDLMCIIDANGIFRRVNPAFTALLGWPEPEILGKSVTEFVSEDDLAATERHFKLMHDGNTAELLVNRIRTSEDNYIYIQWISTLEAQTGLAYSVGRDVSARIKQEGELRRAYEILEQTGEVSNIGGWELHVTSGKVYWSRQTMKIHEVDVDYIPNAEDALLFYKEEDRPRILEAVTQAIDTCKSYDMELRLRTARDREIWVRAIGNTECVDGKCIRLYGTFQDIDERKRRELAFHETRELLDNVLTAASEVCIIATDKQGLITLFNSGAQRMTGYSSADMVGHHTPLFLHKQEEIEAVIKRQSRLYNRRFEGFDAFVYNIGESGQERGEITFVRKDGTEFLASLIITPIRDYQQEIRGYLGVSLDITEQRNAQKNIEVERARLKAFVEHTPAAVAMFDDQLNYVACSKKWLEAYHMVDLNWQGQSLYAVFPDIPELWRERYTKVLQGEVLSCERDIWPAVGGGEDMYLRWELRPWYYASGVIGGVMFLTENISQRVKQEEELEKAKLMAEEASRSKSDFLASMSHEIRTPLNGVIGFADLVLKTELNDTQRQYLQIVSQSGNSLLEIINDILDFSKIEAGKLELDLAEFDLYEMAGQAANVISYQAQKKGVEMLLNIPQDLPHFITGDSVRVRQIIINLLSNAVKFTDRGEIELKIARVQTLGDRVKLRFKVRDTGIGIRPDRQSRIFEAFMQEDLSTTKKYGGTGLGLAISNKLLALMGSKMELVSSPGKGSTFYFDLEVPYRDGDSNHSDLLQSIRSVLVVDDNANNRMILKEMFLLKQIKVDEAQNGMEALSKLAGGKHYDLIILDFHMPFLNGIETAEKIRSAFSEHEQPIIALLHSSAEDSEIVRLGNLLNINLKVSKPVKATEFFSSLSKLIKNDQAKTAVADTGHLEETQELCVMIAEDNPVNMLLARTIVGRVAPLAAIVEAENGEIALSLFRNRRPDLILMDVQMPEMNGYDATKAIRKLDKTVPIIALTAASIKGEREKCLEAGMSDYITKPFVEKTLFDVFEKWLKKNEDIEDPVESFLLNDNSLHFNIHEVSAYLGNDKNLINEVLNMTVAELRDIQHELTVNLGAPNLEELKNLGQKLHGTAHAAGMKRLAQLADSVQLMDEAALSNADQLIKDVLSEMKIVAQIIKKEW